MNEDLINEVRTLAGEVRANEDREAQLREQLAQLCIDNYNQYILPMLVQQRAVLDAISDTLQHYLTLDTYRKQVSIDNETYTLYINCLYNHNNKLQLTIESNPVNDTMIRCRDEADIKSGYWLGNAVVLSKFFGNEEAIQMTSEFINDLFVSQLMTIKNNYTLRNEKLKCIIDELTLRLSTAHVPVPKEDGTVEVMIGGKKFIGKLEEESNGHTNN